MVGIRAVALIFGIVLVQTAAIEEENDLQAKFSQLETQLKVLTQRLCQDEEMFTQQCQQQEEKLTEGLHQEEEKVSGLQLQVESLTKKLDNVTDFLSDSKNGRFEDIIGSSDPDEVSFTAELSSELANVPLDTTIEFDHLIHRTENYYDPSTGIFTCPTSGLYLFAVFIEPYFC